MKRKKLQNLEKSADLEGFVPGERVIVSQFTIPGSAGGQRLALPGMVGFSGLHGVISPASHRAWILQR